MHLTAPLTSVEINNWVQAAIAEAAQRDDAELIDVARAEYEAIPAALKHLAVASLRQHAAFANDAGERAAALRVLEWVTT